MTIADYTFPLFKQVRNPEMPNVLLLFTDEQRYDTIAALGRPHMITPNLDRLVAEGCAFTHGCTPNPVCVAARHSLLTGLYARDHGMPAMGSKVIPPSIPCLPQILADHGYHCEAVGKMHFQPARSHHGFHRFQTQEELYRNIADDDYAMYLRAVGLGHIKHVHGIRNPLYLQPQRSLVQEEHHPNTWVADRAADAIRRCRNRPFFLWASWIHPHPPLALPDRWAELYAGASIPLPTPLEANPNRFLAAQRRHSDYDDPAKTRRVRELYYGAVSMVDYNIGKVLAALAEIGQLDNTLIIFASDHGEMLGDNGAWGKSLPNDPSVRVPFIVRYPKLFKPGSKRDDFADLTDILPTVLDVAGIKYPGQADLPGESLTLTAGSKDRSVHYMEHNHNELRVISLRSHRYKYNYWFDDGREEFYDLERDPIEIENLLNYKLSAAEHDAYEILKARLISYELRDGLRGTVRNGRLAPFEGERWKGWPPCDAGLDWQMPMHIFNLLPEDPTQYQPDRIEVIEATKKEPVLKLSKLNLDFYLSSGGDPELVRQIRERNL